MILYLQLLFTPSSEVQLQNYKILTQSMAAGSITWILVSIISVIQGIGNQRWTVNISSSTSNSFYYYWNKCVGSGHGSLLLRSDWRQYMEDAHNTINFSFVRPHAILHDAVGPYNGVNDYSFVNIDKIYSYLLSIGMKPYVEISSMPSKLAINASQALEHYQFLTSPPTSYDEWYNFIKAWIQHLVDYFGLDEIRSWHFEGICTSSLWFIFTQLQNFSLYFTTQSGTNPMVTFGVDRTKIM